MKFRVLLVLCLFVSGCANITPMAINKSSKTIDTSEKSLVLFSTTLSRPEPSRYVPQPTLIRFEKKNAGSKSDSILFSADNEAGLADSNLSNTFYLRVALAPGEYSLHSILGRANAFPFIGNFELPILTKVSVPEHSIIYLGRIDAVLRPRQDGEFRAGSLVPLIDQAATGISNNTFDVVFKDYFSEDIKSMQEKFPILNGKEIKATIFSEWSRQDAQSWWDGKK